MPSIRRPNLQLRDGAALFAAIPSLIVAEAAAAAPERKQYSVLGYRQTDKPAAAGGKANANGFRFRHKAMRAIARTFRGQPFVTGHNWGDVRARGGTIVDAYAEPPADGPDELGFFYRLEVIADWALRGFEDGTIDRFSMGARGEGEITCTIHGSPVWTDCWCWPLMEIDGVIAEWEYESARGLELSAVNVPAVDGTAVLDELDLDDKEHAAAFERDLEQLAAVCGRRWRPDAIASLVAQLGGAPKGGFPRAGVVPTMTACTTASRGSDQMDRALICKSLGLPATATDEDILARMTQQGTEAGQAEVLRAQLADLTRDRDRVSDNAHVEAEITRLRAERQVSDEVVASLRATAAKPGGRAAFDSTLAIVQASAPRIGAAPVVRATLQSDAKPALVPGAAPGSSVTAAGAVEIDAYDANKDNPELHPLMKRCQLTAEQVRKHGSRTFNVVPGLRDLMAATELRGA
jgi:hypothetical protein